MILVLGNVILGKDYLTLETLRIVLKSSLKDLLAIGICHQVVKVKHVLNELKCVAIITVEHIKFSYSLMHLVHLKEC